MKRQLTLYVGEPEEHQYLMKILHAWGKEHELDFLIESVHSNPAKIVQLGISQLPALVFEKQILAQGDLVMWIPNLLEYVLF